MTRPATGTLLRVLAPLLGGVALGAVLQAAEPRARLYTAASPGLVAVMAGLLAAALVAVVGLARRRAVAGAPAAGAPARGGGRGGVGRGRPGPAAGRRGP